MVPEPVCPLTLNARRIKLCTAGPCSTCEFEANTPARLYLEIDPLFWSRLSWPVLLVGGRAYALD